MSALLNPREMQRPGQGIVREAAPTTDHAEYPKHMVHPGFQPGTADEEIKLPGGMLQYHGGKSIRHPPVLVYDANQEAYEASQGYVVLVKSDPEAFRRAVASAQPMAENYQPVEFPKWSHGKEVKNADEEREWLYELGLDQDGHPVIEGSATEVHEQLRLGSSEPAGEPALDTEVNTREVFPATEGDEIAALEARLAALKAKKVEPIVKLVPPAEPVVMQETVTQVKTGELLVAIDQAAADQDAAAMQATRAERARKMREGKARKKAEREAAKAG